MLRFARNDDNSGANNRLLRHSVPRNDGKKEHSSRVMVWSGICRFVHCNGVRMPFFRHRKRSSRHCERSAAKTGRASINARRFTASSGYKHPHLLRRMFYEHGAKRGNLNRMQTATHRLLRLFVPRNDGEGQYAMMRRSVRKNGEATPPALRATSPCRRGFGKIVSLILCKPLYFISAAISLNSSIDKDGKQRAISSSGILPPSINLSAVSLAIFLFVSLATLIAVSFLISSKI